MAENIDYEDTDVVVIRPIEWYVHHGRRVAVRSDLRGLHQKHCLCFRCSAFKPGPPETNCPKANLLYAVCISTGMTAPVFECPDFKEGGGGGESRGE